MERAQRIAGLDGIKKLGGLGVRRWKRGGYGFFGEKMRFFFLAVCLGSGFPNPLLHFGVFFEILDRQAA